MNEYEGLYILDTKGKDDKIQEFITPVEAEITARGGNVINVQKMDRRKFERVAHKLDSGFYITIRFAALPTALVPLRAKLTLNPSVFRQVYIKVKDGTHLAEAVEAAPTTGKVKKSRTTKAKEKTAAAKEAAAAA